MVKTNMQTYQALSAFLFFSAAIASGGYGGDAAAARGRFRMMRREAISSSSMSSFPPTSSSVPPSSPPASTLVPSSSGPPPSSVPTSSAPPSSTPPSSVPTSSFTTSSAPTPSGPPTSTPSSSDPPTSTPPTSDPPSTLPPSSTNPPSSSSSFPSSAPPMSTFPPPTSVSTSTIESVTTGTTTNIDGTIIPVLWGCNICPTGDTGILLFGYPTLPGVYPPPTPPPVPGFPTIIIGPNGEPTPTESSSQSTTSSTTTSSTTAPAPGLTYAIVTWSGTGGDDSTDSEVQDAADWALSQINKLYGTGSSSAPPSSSSSTKPPSSSPPSSTPPSSTPTSTPTSTPSTTPTTSPPGSSSPSSGPPSSSPSTSPPSSSPPASSSTIQPSSSVPPSSSSVPPPSSSAPSSSTSTPPPTTSTTETPTPTPTPDPEPEKECFGLSTDHYVSRDSLISAIEDFCSNTDRGLQRYNEGTLDDVTLSIDYHEVDPSDIPDAENTCIYMLRDLLTDSCDTDSSDDKAGGHVTSVRDEGVTYNVYPMAQRQPADNDELSGCDSSYKALYNQYWVWGSGWEEANYGSDIEDQVKGCALLPDTFDFSYGLGDDGREWTLTFRTGVFQKSCVGNALSTAGAPNFDGCSGSG